MKYALVKTVDYSKVCAQASTKVGDVLELWSSRDGTTINDANRKMQEYNYNYFSTCACRCEIKEAAY